MAELELGNLMFNTNKNQTYECPEYIITLLKTLSIKLEMYYDKKYNKEYYNPFLNEYNKFYNNVFTVESYEWNDDIEQPYNFKCDDVEISWYKYLGRDTTINGEYSKDYILDIFDKCWRSLDNTEDQHWRTEEDNNE